ncbi:MAG: S41 family peptidase [Candidatus Sungbacteria bacterium]|nr:S41 family peptidase [Candidatus Sungbacteria bacterium]
MLNFDWKRYTKVYLVVVAVFLLGASFFGGIYYGYENRPAAEKVLNVLGQKQPPQFQEVDLNLFWDVWSRLEEKYVDRAKIDRKELIYGAAAGLARALKDPYTEFMRPVESKQFQEDIKGSFSGIGAEIGIRKGTLTVIAPLKDSPAERAGLKAGDKIFKVTEVRLTVLRDSFDKTQEFKIVRDVIKVQILTTEKKSDGIFVIKLHSFTENSGFEFRKAVQEFYASNSQKLILDLRNNPGGFLVMAVDIASWFLPAGEIVAHERFADGSEDVYRSSGYRLLENVPLVVLVNEGSASASEIVAGALRDAKGAKLIGTKTFGKGSVQEVQSLAEGASVKITIAKWLTPKGIEINGTGLEPDVKVELPKEDDQDPKKDLIMEKGVEVLKGL